MTQTLKSILKQKVAIAHKLWLQKKKSNCPPQNPEIKAVINCFTYPKRQTKYLIEYT